MNSFKIYNFLITYKTAIINLMIAILSLVLIFILIKYNYFYLIFIYPFIFYYLLKTYSFVVNIFIFPIIGFLYFISLYFYWFWQGYEVFQYLWFSSIIIFWLSGILASLFYKIYKKENILSFIIFPILFLFTKTIVFSFWFGDNFLFDPPPVFLSYSSYIPYTYIHFLLSVFSISLWVWLWRKNIKQIVITIICILWLWLWSIFLSNPQDIKNKKIITIASIQWNIIGHISERISKADEIIEYYINKTIEVAPNIEVVIWPENVELSEILTWVQNHENRNLGKRIEKLSSDLDIVIVYGWIDKEENKTYDTGFVVDPKKWFLNPYRAQIVFKIPSLAQEEWEVFEVYDTSYWRFFILICYEAIFLDIVKEFKKLTNDNQVDYFITIANNQFLWKKEVMNILEWNYRAIAATIDKPLISSTNTGPTIYIDNNWKIIKKIDRNIEGVMYSKVLINDL